MIEDDKYLPNMQAYLTASTDGNNGKEFKLSTFLSSVYDEIVNNHVNITQPSINEPLTVTAANNSRIVNCNTLVHLNQTEISVEVIFSRFNTVVKNIYKYHKIPIVKSTYSYYLLVLISFYDHVVRIFFLVLLAEASSILFVTTYIFFRKNNK